MSEQEKEIAIAKMKAQGCRRWMTILVIAPVFLCAALAVLNPNIRTFLAKREANQQCRILPEQDTSVTSNTVFAVDAYASDIVITSENINQLTMLGETTLSSDVYAVIPESNHPNSDYAIYAEDGTNGIRRFFICDTDNQALGAFTGDDNTEVAFNVDGLLFAVADSELGQVRLFDGIEIRELEAIELPKAGDSRQIDSLAFHPTQPLFFIISENEIFVFEIEAMTQIFRLPISETVNHDIGFDADGTLFFIINSSDNQGDVWGIGE